MILIQPWAQKLRNQKENPKNPPIKWWNELVSLLKDYKLVQIGVDGEEQLVEDFRKNLKFNELVDLFNECDTFIGVDSFGQHLAWYLNKPGIVIWGQSDPIIFGHDIHKNLLLSRDNLREKQFWLWEQAEYREDVFISPIKVLEQVQCLDI